MTDPREIAARLTEAQTRYPVTSALWRYLMGTVSRAVLAELDKEPPK